VIPAPAQAPPPDAGAPDAPAVAPSEGALAVAEAIGKAARAAAAKLPEAMAAAVLVTLEFAADGAVTVDVDGETATLAASELGLGDAPAVDTAPKSDAPPFGG
jgi:hypothetical protein